MAQGHPWQPRQPSRRVRGERDGRWRVAAYDFATRRETVSRAAARARRPARGRRPRRGDLVPRWAPDGRALAFVRDGRELRVVDLDASGGPGRERLLATAIFDRPPFDDPRDVEWSHDGRWVAYVAPSGPKNFANVWVVPADGGAAPRAISAVPNSSSGSLSWSPDGTALYFVTGQRTEPGQIARIDLVPRAPRFREDQFRDLFGPATPSPFAPRDSAAPPAARGTRRVDSLLAAAPDTAARAGRDTARPRRPRARRRRCASTSPASASVSPCFPPGSTRARRP
jgi:Tol biopolymer transport system component